MNKIHVIKGVLMIVGAWMIMLGIPVVALWGLISLWGLQTTLIRLMFGLFLLMAWAFASGFDNDVL